jgi:hypothetical protein
MLNTDQKDTRNMDTEWSRAARGVEVFTNLYATHAAQKLVEERPDITAVELVEEFQRNLAEVVAAPPHPWEVDESPNTYTRWRSEKVEKALAWTPPTGDK